MGKKITKSSVGIRAQACLFQSIKKIFIQRLQQQCLKHFTGFVWAFALLLKKLSYQICSFILIKRISGNSENNITMMQQDEHWRNRNNSGCCFCKSSGLSTNFQGLICFLFWGRGGSLEGEGEGKELKRSRPWSSMKLIFLWKGEQKTFLLEKGKANLASKGMTCFLRTARNATVQISWYQSILQCWVRPWFLPLTPLWNIEHFAMNAKFPVWEETVI